MLCPSPIDIGRHVPCGQCIACRINRRRAWTLRFILEASCHPFTSFVTLTYDEDHVPLDDHGGQVLVKSDAQNWFKRLRHTVSNVRYALVGEYGPKTWRPHFHALLFGLDPATLDETLPETWRLGFTSVYAAEQGHFQYVAAYTVKKLTKPSDDRLEGKPPEFATYSRQPPIGGATVKELADSFRRQLGDEGVWNYVLKYGDIPRTVRLDGKFWPLDQTMLKLMRFELAVPELASLRPKATEQPPDVYYDAPKKTKAFYAAERASRRQRAKDAARPI